jgi:hypothetical protein
VSILSEQYAFSIATHTENGPIDADSVARISRAPSHSVQKQQSIDWRFTEVLAGHVSFDLTSQDFSMQECRDKGTFCAMKAYLTIEIDNNPKREYINSSQRISGHANSCRCTAEKRSTGTYFVTVSCLRSQELLYEQLPERSSFLFQTTPTLKRRQSRTYWSWCSFKVSSFRSTVTKHIEHCFLRFENIHGDDSAQCQHCDGRSKYWWWYTSHHVTLIPETTSYFSMLSRTPSDHVLADVYVPCLLRCPSLSFLLPSIFATSVSHG